MGKSSPIVNDDVSVKSEKKGISQSLNDRDLFLEAPKAGSTARSDTSTDVGNKSRDSAKDWPPLPHCACGFQKPAQPHAARLAITWTRTYRNGDRFLTRHCI